MRHFSALIGILALAGCLQAQDQKDKKKDPDQIGNRDVSKGVNWYSIERDMALGKQLAAQVKHNSRVIDDPAPGRRRES